MGFNDEKPCKAKLRSNLRREPPSIDMIDHKREPVRHHKQRMANYTASFIDQQDPDTFTRLVSDPSAMVKPTVADECGLTQVELYIREYIHEIHKKSRQIKTHFYQLGILTM